MKNITESDYYECSKGFSCVRLSFRGEKFYLNGLIQYPVNKNFPGKRRKIYRPYIVTQNDIDYIRLFLLNIEKSISEEGNKRVKDSVSFLHDIRTSVGLVLSWCQAVIDRQPGTNFEDKLKYVHGDMVNLFYAINLLQEQLSLADIIANPESITYGKKHRFKLHGFLYKHVGLFEARANATGCEIILKGHTDAEIEAFNSFQFIPLVLLDNAVKYSWKKSEIFINLEEKGSDISLSICSQGKIVPIEFREKIFEKYIRTPNVEQKYQGMGVGLYIARLIAKAHETSIEYKCSTQDQISGINEFAIRMKRIK